MTPDLFSYMAERPNYRTRDPITSRDAGNAARRFAKGDQAAILSALTRACRPMAGEEISGALDWNDMVRVLRRMKELERAGSIVRTVEFHINRSGRRAFRYRVSEFS